MVTRTLKGPMSSKKIEFSYEPLRVPSALTPRIRRQDAYVTKVSHFP